MCIWKAVDITPPLVAAFSFFVREINWSWTFFTIFNPFKAEIPWIASGFRSHQHQGYRTWEEENTRPALRCSRLVSKNSPLKNREFFTRVSCVRNWEKFVARKRLITLGYKTFNESKSFRSTQKGVDTLWSMISLAWFDIHFGNYLSSIWLDCVWIDGSKEKKEKLRLLKCDRNFI